MNKKIIGFIALSILAIFSPSSVYAYAGIPGIENVAKVTQVSVTPQYITEISTVYCEDGSVWDFDYKQLMAVPGLGAVWVGVDSIYGTGHKDVSLIAVCETESGETVHVYGLGSCEC